MAKLIERSTRGSGCVIADSAIDIMSDRNAVDALIFELYMDKLDSGLPNRAFVLRLTELEAEKLAKTILEGIERNKPCNT